MNVHSTDFHQDQKLYTLPLQEMDLVYHTGWSINNISENYDILTLVKHVKFSAFTLLETAKVNTEKFTCFT